MPGMNLWGIGRYRCSLVATVGLVLLWSMCNLGLCSGPGIGQVFLHPAFWFKQLIFFMKTLITFLSTLLIMHISIFWLSDQLKTIVLYSDEKSVYTSSSYEKLWNSKIENILRAYPQPYLTSIPYQFYSSKDFPSYYCCFVVIGHLTRM